MKTGRGSHLLCYSIRRGCVLRPRVLPPSFRLAVALDLARCSPFTHGFRRLNHQIPPGASTRKGSPRRAWPWRDPGRRTRAKRAEAQLRAVHGHRTVWQALLATYVGQRSDPANTQPGFGSVKIYSASRHSYGLNTGQSNTAPGPVKTLPAIARDWRQTTKGKPRALLVPHVFLTLLCQKGAERPRPCPRPSAGQVLGACAIVLHVCTLPAPRASACRRPWSTPPAHVGSVRPARRRIPRAAGVFGSPRHADSQLVPKLPVLHHQHITTLRTCQGESPLMPRQQSA